MLRILPIMPSLMPVNVARYAIVPPLLFPVILTIKKLLLIIQTK